MYFNSFKYKWFLIDLIINLHISCTEIDGSNFLQLKFLFLLSIYLDSSVLYSFGYKSINFLPSTSFLSITVSKAFNILSSKFPVSFQFLVASIIISEFNSRKHYILKMCVRVYVKLI